MQVASHLLRQPHSIILDEPTTGDCFALTLNVLAERSMWTFSSAGG